MKYGGTSIYEGQWYMGKREGWGRMIYATGSVYEGQWKDNEYNGPGILTVAHCNLQYIDGVYDPGRAVDGRDPYYQIKKGEFELGSLKSGDYDNDAEKIAVCQ